MIKYFLFFRACKTLPIFRRFFKQKFFRHNMGCGNLVFRSGDCSVSFMTIYDDANELFKYFLVLKLSSFSITTPWSQYTRETKNMFSHYFKTFTQISPSGAFWSSNKCQASNKLPFCLVASYKLFEDTVDIPWIFDWKNVYFIIHLISWCFLCRFWLYIVRYRTKIGVRIV